MYQALDMGPAAVLEVLILPQTDISTAAANSQKQQQQSISSNQNMILTAALLVAIDIPKNAEFAFVVTVAVSAASKGW